MWGMISSSHCYVQIISNDVIWMDVGQPGYSLASASHTSTQDDVTANQVPGLVADGVGGFFEVTAVGWDELRWN